MKRFMSLIAVLVVLSGCNGQGDERLAEKASIEAKEVSRIEIEAAYERGMKEAEGQFAMREANMDKLLEQARQEARAAAEEELSAQNGNLARRALEMESDLEIRHRFFQSVRGTYEGKFQTENGEFMIRLTLVPSLMPYPVSRVRTLEEIATDLTGLHFNAQVLQWSPSNPLSAVGCRVERIKPDLSTGQVFISSENCPNFYAIAVSDPELLRDRAVNPRNPGKPVSEEVSQELASEITRGTRTSVPALSGILQPTTNAAVYSFVANKLEQ